MAEIKSIAELKQRIRERKSEWTGKGVDDRDTWWRERLLDELTACEKYLDYFEAGLRERLNHYQEKVNKAIETDDEIFLYRAYEGMVEELRLILEGEAGRRRGER